jgi:signal transduction histidine kinase
MGSRVDSSVPPHVTARAEHLAQPPRLNPRALVGGPWWPYPDLVRQNTLRTLLEAAGQDALEAIVTDFLDALGTAVTVFESNGDYASGARPRGWCAVVDELSWPAHEEDATEAIDSGRWSCRASCRQPALEAMRTGAPAEFDCPGGMRVRAIPIRAEAEVVGSISFGCGGPPTDDARLGALAVALGTTVDHLRREAAQARPRSADVEDAVRRGVEVSAKLLGELVARRRAMSNDERARELFVGVFAHDLRNSLAAILVSSELLCTSAARDPGSRTTAEQIARSARLMERLIEYLLDVTRVRAGVGIALRLAPCALDRLCADAVDEVRGADPRREIRQRVKGDVTTSCDAVRIHELVVNLLTNAFRHGDGGPVDLGVDGSPRELALTVHNGGPPIPAEQLPRLFDPFIQGRPTAGGRRSGGLGLGLYIVREIVRAHGGTIDVASEPASGTTFIVRLPRR